MESSVAVANVLSNRRAVGKNSRWLAPPRDSGRYFSAPRVSAVRCPNGAMIAVVRCTSRSTVTTFPAISVIVESSPITSSYPNRKWYDREGVESPQMLAIGIENEKLAGVFGRD